MAILLTLVEATPYSLEYLCEADGKGTSGVLDIGVLTNRGVGSPDLTGDATVKLHSPIYMLVNKAAATDMAAQQWMQGRGLIDVPDIVVPRAHVTLTPLDALPVLLPLAIGAWAVNAAAGVTLDMGARPAGSTGYPCLVVYGPMIKGAQALLHIKYAYSAER